MSSYPYPKVSKALVVQKSNGDGPYKFDAVLEEKPVPELKSDEVLLKLTAVGFNHKDVWVRKGMYPAITVGSPYGGDGAGIIIASGTPDDALLNKRVLLNPSHGWKSDPVGPESYFSILGSSPVGGTFAEYLVVKRELVIPSPEHLEDVHVAALPVGAVTAWRATMVNAQIQPGHNVLITGIGGGVALLALQFCIAAGANVYVTSGTKDKIDRAVGLGAKGGANYKDKDWPAQINDLLQKDKKGSTLDAVIDSAGGNIFGQIGRTANPSVTLTMKEVLKNHQFIGSTMGSQKDLEDATAFISKHRIVPILSRVIEGGLESAEEGFQLLASGEQFGKVVIRLGQGAGGASDQSKL
ncbi:hypothetical protein EST38_g13376 [Candolleomyces aberdarensis]|uniref:Enoyl reductase (ER) domain-containing protein n=1 Tax=Candolleomyces aberdarensis TaxID=2316362 RepID=A0A4Q2D0T7_9AGAR|nr:hypothetical protein EST38_g13376 [Candolleomyces aberdarensis]